MDGRARRHRRRARLGGDPGNVTIFGESGGGAKVSVLLGLPDARALFHRAVSDVLPAHQFDPVAAPTAATVPLLIGTTRDEMTLFTAMMPGFDQLTEEALAAAGPALAGRDAGAVLGVYRRTRGEATPAQRLTAAMTDRFRIGSIRLAERKLAGGPAPVWMYRLDFETPVLGGKLGAPHALDIAFVFDNLAASRLHGDRPEADDLAVRMSGSWLAFARSGDPNHPGLPPRPAYDTDRRPTMIFDVDCHLVDDPDGEERLAWEDLLGGL